MAVEAAHFTATSLGKPSIFEIIAHNALNEALHPAGQRLVLVLANNFPEKFKWLSTYYDEVFLILNAILQSHYIFKYGSSFAENFYGLKRVSIKTNNLSSYDKYTSLAVLIIIPYLRRKFDEKIMLYRIQKAEGSLKNDIHDNFKRLLTVSHSTFHLVWGFCTIFNYLRYMSNQSDSQHPTLKLIGLKLMYDDNKENLEGFWSALFGGQLSLSEASSGLVQNIANTALELSAFFLQFLQVWNAEKPNFNPAALPLVPPPPLDGKAKNYSGRCPICLQVWRIPTVLPVSGYVFCFPCILKHLRETQRCPVTNLPAKPLDVIRLYDN